MIGKESIRVLLVEDSESDAALVVRRLDRAGYEVDSERVENREGMCAALASRDWDVIIADHRLAEFDAPAALAVLQNSGRDIPFLIVSGSIGEELAVALMKSGAHDYVAKDNLSRLVPAVDREIREARARYDHRRAGRDLRAAQQRLQQVVSSNPAVLYTLGIENGRVLGVTWISENVRTILGYSPELTVGRNWWAANIHPADLERMGESTRGELFVQGHTEHEFRFRHADGEYRWTRSEMRLIRDDDGHPIEASGVWTDITARKRAEEEHERLREQLQQAQKLESVGRLAGGIAHDFNNLLTVINGYTAMLLRRVDASSPMHDSLEEIRIAGERATSLSQQLLTLSRKTVLQPTKVNVNVVAVEVERMLRRVIGEDVLIETTLAPELGAVLADSGQLNQVLMNLAVNARDAMPNGGTLRIETANAELDAGEAEDRGLQPGAYVCLRVSDTGAGIPADALPHLFEPFFTTKTKGRGTGLGLATVYSIVKQCGGAISVESETSLGATFTIFLPEVTGMSEAEPEPAPSGDLRGEGTVLLVEDEDQVRKITARVLADAGYNVLECATPDEALGFAEAYPDEIRLMLSDIVMPGMNGLELANRVKPLRPDMKTILMSGYADHASVNTASIEKAGEYLAKPFTPDALKAKVLKTLAACGSKQTILVVDDEPPVRRLICEILTAAGYSAMEAANGLEAVRLVHTLPIDLMITDLSMPEQEGLETIRMLHREHSELKMIAISGRFPPPMLRAAEMFGAHASLAKPIDRDELLETVARVIQGGNL